jgi:hypothetical protein
MLQFFSLLSPQSLQWIPQFLCDNGENDGYFYMLTVYTGMRRGSATTSNVNFILAGEEDDSGIRVMSDSYCSVSSIRSENQYM